MLQQASVFLKQNPGEAHITPDELRDIAQNNDSSHIFSKLFRYTANVTGTPAYWHKVRSDLKTIINQVGPPTFFFTFSAADMHWPELQSLLGDGEESTSATRRQNVINCGHLVDFYLVFTFWLDKFIKHWLYDTLEALWHWYRHEYQGRGTYSLVWCGKIEK